MDQPLAVQVIGALLAVIGTLIVILLGYLHVRLNRIEAKNDERTSRMYDHLDAHFVRRETAEAQRDALGQQISGLNRRLDAIMQMLAHSKIKEHES